MNNYQLKLLAICLMVIDHIGLLFFPHLAVLRIIGRFSFPLFAYLLCQGELHTKSFNRYALRLFVFGCISQPVYHSFSPRGDLNIFFTLLLGLCLVRFYRLYPKYRWLFLALGFLASLPVSYGIYGVALILLVSRFKHTPAWWFSWAVLHFFAASGVQQFAIFAPLLFSVSNNQQGQKMKWAYIFYPAHLCILLGVKLAWQFHIYG